MIRHKEIPENAVFNQEHNEWELGQKDENGKNIGEWNYWLVKTGKLCCKTIFEPKNNSLTFTRFHNDGTYSWKGQMKNDKLIGISYFQKSQNETTETIMLEPFYKNVFSCNYDYENDIWEFYDDKNIKIDRSGNPIITLEMFAKNFNNYELTKEFSTIVDFEFQYGKETYSQTFALSVSIEDKNFISSLSSKKEFGNKFMPFAKVKSMGSIFALWINDENKKLNQLPVVVFGYKGEIKIVCENILELLHLLTHDEDLLVNNAETKFYIDKKNYKKYQESPNHKKYLKLIEQNFSLKKIENPNEILIKTQQNLTESLELFLKNYI